ncbi:MAG: nitronate monooxygenase [Chloroflexi bacterium]|nr:nitronate monooxygenase [Chloroflexota bacterium]
MRNSFPASQEAAYPTLIQGGMGAGVSNWQLARAVALAGVAYQSHAPVLGVVSGTGIHNLMVNRLQDGDPGGHIQRAIEAFPLPALGEMILEKYHRNVKRPSGSRYRFLPKLSELLNEHARDRMELIALLVCGSFVEVWLAKEGHQAPIGINYLEKAQLPRLFELFGAMLAGVDYVLMGAGIPSQIPGVLDRLASWQPATYRLDVAEATQRHEISFDPATIMPAGPALKRPRFLAIIASHVLAKALATRASGFVDGFVIEGSMAGGHNAPPRGQYRLNALGEPIYGERDIADLEELRRLGRPFWLAGGYASPERLREAIEQGARGIQVGTMFAYSDESGIRADLKAELRDRAFRGDLVVIADPLASPSGFPFQVAQLDGTLSDAGIYDARPRMCSLGYLVQPYETPTGAVGVRCSAEPVSAYVRKGGRAEDAVGRRCICNALLATTGLGEHTRVGVEPPIVTSGRDYEFVRHLMTEEKRSYTAEEAIGYLLHGAATGGGPGAGAPPV